MIAAGHICLDITRYFRSRKQTGTGAGDTSITAFLTAMLKGNSLAELKEKIKNGWEKN